MSGYRIRVAHDPVPQSFWRDIVVGSECVLADLQSVINDSVGLDNYHLWFFGANRDYWDSVIKYQHPEEYDTQSDAELAVSHDITENADETTLSEMSERLRLEPGDSFCYLYDYGDEWRFECTIDAIDVSIPDSYPPQIVDSNGGTLEQYESTPTATTEIPAPLDSFLSDGPVPSAEVRALETREDVVHTLVLVESTATDSEQQVCERFGVQFRQAAYLLEYFPYGWDVVREIPGEDKSETALLAELVGAIKSWHEEITEMVDQTVSMDVSDQTLRMNHQLDSELDRIRNSET